MPSELLYFDPKTGTKIVKAWASGPSSYSSPASLVVDGLIVVKDVIAMWMTNGYIAVPAGVSGTTVYYKVYTGAGSEVAAGTDLSSQTVYVVVIGY